MTTDLKNMSVSHATMRTEDLIPSFIDAIRAIDPSMTDSAKLAEIEAAAADEEYHETEEASFDLEYLFDTLNNYAPAGFYFGSHPGDGSDYGFWQCEEMDEE